MLATKTLLSVSCALSGGAFEVAARLLLRFMVRPEEVARAVVCLLSGVSFVTVCDVMDVDGGFMAGGLR